MQELRKALADIDAIRGQVARVTVFRGYGPATVALTGILALAAAGLQALWLENPPGEIAAYLTIWIGVALVSAAVIAVETVTRSRRFHSSLADEMIFSALEQLVPIVVAGVLLTFVLVRFAPASAWLLPGLWQILFSLGIFASSRLMPKSLFVAGIWYLTTGLLCVAAGPDGQLLSLSSWSPLAMGLPFGIGQLLMAGILHRALGGLDGEE